MKVAAHLVFDLTHAEVAVNAFLELRATVLCAAVVEREDDIALLCHKFEEKAAGEVLICH